VIGAAAPPFRNLIGHGGFAFRCNVKVKRGWSFVMSDPRFTDPRYTDPRRPPESDPAAMRRFDLERERNSGAMWGWAAAIFALIMVMAVVIGYNRSGTVATNAPNAPSTTGAAPATPRTPIDQAAPSLTPPPAFTPAPSSEPAPAPAPSPASPPAPGPR
jgi:hypothetical protein